MGINACSPYLATHSRILEKKWYFECEKKEVRTVFYIFLTFSWRIDASVNHVSGFSSIFAANIRSRLFSANDNNCKPGLICWNGVLSTFPRKGLYCWCSPFAPPGLSSGALWWIILSLDMGCASEPVPLEYSTHSYLKVFLDSNR